MKPLTKEQFRDSLQKGLGRAVQHICEHGANGLEGYILDACLHNRAYDPQMEGSRDEWMLSIIELTGKQDFYFPKILKAHSEITENDHDLDQLNGFMFQFAKRNIPGARESLYEKFNSRKTSDSWLGRTEIVDLDGLKGFIHIINVLGEKLINDEDFYLFGQVSEMFSEEEVKECLSLAGETNPIIKKYYDAVMEFNGKGKEEDIPDSNELSLEEVFNIIDRTKDRNRNFELRSFGRKAKIFEIEQVLGRLLKEDEKFKKLACLEVFTDRAFPSLELGLFDLLQVEDKDIRYNSIWAMSNVEDKKVREFAVNYLNAKGKKCDPSMLKLLENNYQPGDHKLIESVLKDWDDPDDNHEAVLNLLRINDKKERPELAGGFLWAYDHTPCSHCRGSIVESLVDWEEAPVLMLEECLMDCQEDTVELAKSSFE